jgi:hypothetical protein
VLLQADSQWERQEFYRLSRQQALLLLLRADIKEKNPFLKLCVTAGRFSMGTPGILLAEPTASVVAFT